MDESIKDNNASVMSIDEKTAYDAFVKLMASLIRKYGPKIEEEETKIKNKIFERRLSSQWIE